MQKTYMMDEIELLLSRAQKDGKKKEDNCKLLKNEHINI